MKRMLLPLLLGLCLLMTGCGKSRGEEAFDAFSDRINHLEALTFTAQVRAEYEHKTARFTLSYREDADGAVVTVLAPELIAGIEGHVRPDGTTLEYDRVVLDTGSLDALGLSPMSSLPVFVHALRMGHCDSCWEEDGKTVLQLVPDDDLKCTVWFDKSDMTPLRAELITDGRVTVVLELHDWAETPSAGA